ncbi:hypothetical protein AB0883_13180 [Micromonospora sp. NPDC047812]|uniref:hypothetical protein n=1 Tax=Micromonospora sp. NPDC047812 TaxID=3155742 RepID=UPI003452AF53
MTYEEFADSRLAALLRYAVMLTGDPHQAQDLPLVDLLKVLPGLGSVDPVGLSLPVGPPEGPGRGLSPDPKEAPAFLAALREDRLARWVAQHPDQVNRTR